MQKAKDSFVPLGILLCLCQLPVSVVGQQNSPTGRDSKPTNAPPSATSETKKNLLETDPRLKVKVTLQREATTLAKALRALTEQTQIRLVAEGNEVGPTEISCRYKDTPLKDVLDSLAAVRNFEWEHKKSGTWILREGYDPHRLDTYRPHSETEATLFQKGREFVNQFSKMSPELQQAISNHRANGLPFDQMPPDMQFSVRDMVAARVQSLTEQGQNSQLNPNDLGNVRVWMAPINRQEGFDHYNLHVFDGHEDQCLDFPIFSDPRENYNIVPGAANGNASWSDEKEDRTSRQEALESDTRLNVKVTLKMRSTTFAEALQELTSTLGLPFAAQYSRINAVKKSFAFEKMPLKEVLDRLVVLYRFKQSGFPLRYTWGERKSGVFMFHLAPDLDALRPQQEEAARGRALLDRFSKLSPEMKEKLAAEDGVAFNALPKEMQQAVQQAFQTQGVLQLGNGLSTGNLANAFIRLRPESQSNFWLSFGSPGNWANVRF